MLGPARSSGKRIISGWLYASKHIYDKLYLLGIRNVDEPLLVYNSIQSMYLWEGPSDRVIPVRLASFLASGRIAGARNLLSQLPSHQQRLLLWGTDTYPIGKKDSRRMTEFRKGRKHKTKE